MGPVIILLLQLAACVAAGAPQELFAEEAAISPLSSGHVQVHLHFTLSAPSRRHYAVLPKAIGQLAAAVPFSEVELSLTQGRWHHHTWGSPILPAKPSGAELRAAFSPSIPEEQLPLLWGNLSHSLSGMFCASLNFLARPETTALQAIEFAPSYAPACGGDGGEDTDGCRSGERGQTCEAPAAMEPRAARQRWLYAALPKEVVCTENLTPALKLLPCRDQAGVASLLLHRPTALGADYHSLRVRITAARTPDGALLHTRLSLSVALVLRPPAGPASTGAAARRPAPRPRTYSSWHLGGLMGAGLRGACPVADISRLLVQLPPQLAELAAADPAVADQLLAPPAWQAAATKDASDAGGGGGEGGSSEVAGGEDQEQQRRQAAETGDSAPGAGTAAAAAPRRPATWETDEFTLTPAPDAVMIGRSGGSGGGTGGIGGVFYAYDLRALERERWEQLASAAGGEGEGPTLLEVGQAWKRYAAKGAAAAGGPDVAVARYTTGAGFMNGGMVLRITAAGAAGFGAGGGGGGGDGEGEEGAVRTVCVFQAIPWYVRAWLHTLRLSVDGAPADLDATLRLRHVSPAADRARPLVLDLCLDLPAAAREAVLSLDFSKAFLHVFEWPPDAHRGFDVPAALVTLAPPRAVAGGLDWGWRAAAGSGGGGGGGASPLLEEAGAPRASQLYSEGLLIPLAPPDFSMPYNVVCLTSTVLAVYVGAALNALLRRLGEELRAAGKGAGARAARLKALKVVLVVVVFGGLALYVDEELQGQVRAALVAAGLAEPLPGPEQQQQRRH